MTKIELEAWAIDEFWRRYKGLVSVPFRNKWTGGDRGKAVAAILKLNPSESLRNEILAAIEAQGRHRVALFEKLKHDRAEYEKAKGLIYCNREGSTWINNKGWFTEIPSLTEVQEATAKGGFTCIHCPSPVKVKLTLCNACNKKYKSEFDFDWLIKKGIISQNDPLDIKLKKCKKYLIESGFKAGVLKTLTSRLTRKTI